jgi:hypothetical protein
MIKNTNCEKCDADVKTLFSVKDSGWVCIKDFKARSNKYR